MGGKIVIFYSSGCNRNSGSCSSSYDNNIKIGAVVAHKKYLKLHVFEIIYCIFSTNFWARTKNELYYCLSEILNVRVEFEFS